MVTFICMVFGFLVGGLVSGTWDGAAFGAFFAWLVMGTWE